MGSKERRITGLDTPGVCFAVERFSGSSVRLSGDSVQLCLAVYRHVGARVSVSAQEPVDIPVGVALPGALPTAKTGLDIHGQPDAPMHWQVRSTLPDGGPVQWAWPWCAGLRGQGCLPAVRVLVADRHLHHAAPLGAVSRFTAGSNLPFGNWSAITCRPTDRQRMRDVPRSVQRPGARPPPRRDAVRPDVTGAGAFKPADIDGAACNDSPFPKCRFMPERRGTAGAQLNWLVALVRIPHLRHMQLAIAPNSAFCSLAASVSALDVTEPSHRMLRVAPRQEISRWLTAP